MSVVPALENELEPFHKLRRVDPMTPVRFLRTLLVLARVTQSFLLERVAAPTVSLFLPVSSSAPHDALCL
jgi:hypothetical protein